MRIAILQLIYSGELFFVAAVMFIVAVLLDVTGALDARPSGRRVASLLAALAIPLAAMSGTPMNLLLAAALVAGSIAYVYGGFAPLRRRFRWVGIASLILALIATALELPYHFGSAGMPTPSRIIVLGDSLSAGDFGEQDPWPSVLEKLTGAEVTNLSTPSETLVEAATRPDLRGVDGGCIIIELGGNDMLEGTRVSQVEDSLDALLTQLQTKERECLLMFELPLLPGRWSYGAVQRRLAASRHVVLIPKRILASVLLDPRNTSDGLHLTQRGHDELARKLVEWAGWKNRNAESGEVGELGSVAMVPPLSSTMPGQWKHLL